MEPVNIKAAADREQEIIHEKKRFYISMKAEEYLEQIIKHLKTTKIEIGIMKIFMRMSWQFAADILTNSAAGCKVILHFATKVLKSVFHRLSYFTKWEYKSMYADRGIIKDELIITLTTELPVLRSRLGISQEKMASSIGVTRQTYSAIETKTKKMS